MTNSSRLPVPWSPSMRRAPIDAACGAGFVFGPAAQPAMAGPAATKNTSPIGAPGPLTPVAPIVGSAVGIAVVGSVPPLSARDSVVLVDGANPGAIIDGVPPRAP